MARAVVLLTACLLAAIVSSAPAGARSAPARLSVHQDQPLLRGAASRQHLIVVRAHTRPGALCRATVAVRKTRQALARVRASKRGRASWRWTILPTSPSGNWRFTTRCRAGRRRGAATRAVLIVTDSRRARGPIGDPRSLSTPDGEVAGKGGAVQCGPFTYAVTQCTCLAYLRRRDVYDTAVARGIPRGGPRAAGRDYYVWDGQQWLVNARRAGIPTGTQPVVGALVVWGVPDSAAYGHVAYVEAVNSPTSVRIAECNYDWNGSCRSITINPQAKANFQGYVYGGPAGNGPGDATPGGGSTGGSTGGGPAPLGGAGTLEFVKTRNTGSGRVEVHTATAGSGYQDGQHSVSWFSPADASNGWFQMVGSDLFFIKTKNVGSGRVEVHTATAGSGYQDGQHSVSWFSPADADNGWFQIAGGGDLQFIKTKNVGSGHVEVHTATAASGYQDGQHAVSWFSPADANNGWFQMYGGDLYFVKTKNVESGHVEVHVATGASGYQSVRHYVSWFSPADADNGWFQIAGGGDLQFIKTKNVGSGHVEVHTATAASGYQDGQHAVSWFSPADANNGWFQIAGGKG